MSTGWASSLRTEPVYPRAPAIGGEGPMLSEVLVILALHADLVIDTSPVRTGYLASEYNNFR
jgi:hypothetical protein